MLAALRPFYVLLGILPVCFGSSAWVQDLTHASEIKVRSLEVLLQPSDCIRTALDGLLPECERVLDPNVRAYYSVQLSLCELEAAGISTPKHCNGLSRSRTSVTRCTRTFESHSQWWTTYSGNYQLIELACSERRRDYDAERSVRVLQNLTEFQYQLVSDLNLAYTELKRARSASADSLSVAHDLSTVIESMESRSAALNDTLARFELELDMVSDQYSSQTVLTQQVMSAQHRLRSLLLEAGRDIKSLIAETTVLHEEIISTAAIEISGVVNSLGSDLSVTHGILAEIMLSAECLKEEISSIKDYSSAIVDVGTQNLRGVLLTQMSTQAISDLQVLGDAQKQVSREIERSYVIASNMSERVMMFSQTFDYISALFRVAWSLAVITVIATCASLPRCGLLYRLAFVLLASVLAYSRLHRCLFMLLVSSVAVARLRTIRFGSRVEELPHKSFVPRKPERLELYY